MNRFVILLYWALCPGALSGMILPGQQSRPLPRPDTRANVAGTVVNALTGKPLEQAHVMLVGYSNRNAPFYGAVSDTHGHFSIVGVPPSTYLVLVTRPGFILLPGAKNNALTNGALILKPGEQLQDLTLKMTPRSIIAGHVFDEYGDPVMNVSVSTVPLTPISVPQLYPQQSTTNDRGEFRIVALPGRYYVQAAPMFSVGGLTEIRTDGTVDSNYLETYYPGVTDIAGAAPVEVLPGHELSEVDLRLARSAVLSIGGRIVDIPDDVHLVSVKLEYGPDARHLSSGSESSFFSNGKPDGKFRFPRLNPGFYRVFAVCNSDKKEMQSPILELNLSDSSYENIQLSLAPGSDVTGAVETPASSPATGARRERRTVTLRVVNSRSSYGARSGEIATDGTFKIADVFPRRYRVSLEPLPENGFIKALQLNGATVQGRVLDFSDGAEGAHLKIILSENGGRISGHLKNEKGANVTALAFVAMARDPDEAGGEILHSALSPEGLYQFNGLAPGRYRLLAISFEMARDVDGAFRKHGSQAEIIEIKEGDKVQKDLKLATVEEDHGSPN